MEYLDWGKIEIRCVLQQFSILPLWTGWGGKAKSSVYAKIMKMLQLEMDWWENAMQGVATAANNCWAMFMVFDILKLKSSTC